MALIDRVHVARRFQKSIKIDADLRDPRALEGFVCPKSSCDVLLTMARHAQEAQQTAFTWTGPYGTGKSSLALALCSLLSGNARIRSDALSAVGKVVGNAYGRAFPPGTKGWHVLPIVGQRAALSEILGTALVARGLVSDAPKKWNDDLVIHAIEKQLSGRREVHGGLILILDEMGKCLEGAAQDNFDLYLLQRIAELANRSKGRLIFVGILHQAFEEYSQRVARDLRDEWAKIQGRFVDLVVNSGGDEQLDLLTRALQSERPPKHQVAIAEAIAIEVRKGRAGASANLSETLAKCWPLHPVVACLLGPLSRRRFGQNQRSLFGFLNSAEPFGFQEFLRDAGDKDLFRPDRLWEYLRSNLEPSILASPDGHRWSMAVEAVERCLAVAPSPLHTQILKTVALLDLFRERSGLSASELVVVQCCTAPKAEIVAAIKDLQTWSFIAYRRHLDAYAVHAGSDFDMEQALADALETIREVDFEQLRSLAGLQPVLAKRHYHAFGALRWFDVDIIPLSAVPTAHKTRRRLRGAIGEFLLAVPSGNESPSDATKVCQEAVDQGDGFTLVGLSASAWEITQLAREFLGISKISEERPELAGDAVARREVLARLADIRSRLEASLQKMFETAKWHLQGEKPSSFGYAQINTLTSDLADKKYEQSPKLPNELLNRQEPSSNAISAQKALLKLMVLREGQPRLGIEGFPAEGGLFDSILASSHLYQEIDGALKFAVPPKRSDKCNLRPAWIAAEEYLKKHMARPVTAEELYGEWNRAPIGVKEGLLPVLLVSFFAANREKLAFYREGIFQARFSDLDIDYLAADAKSIQVRWMDLSKTSRNLLEGLAEIVRELDTENALVHLKPIDVARGLVAVHEVLPPWSRRTMRLSANALRIRMLFKHAADPNKFVFDDIPALLGEDGSSPEIIVEYVKDGLRELTRAYPNMLARLREMMLTELHVPNATPRALLDLRERAENIKDLNGDFRLNAFVNRLGTFSGSDIDMEGLASLATNKPSRDWTDVDLDTAAIEIADFSQRFVRSESYAHVKGRPDKRQAMAVVVGLNGRSTPVSGDFSIADADRKMVDGLIARVEETLLNVDGGTRETILAALAEISAKYLGLQKPAKRSNHSAARA
jgi:hypothetical protein